MLQWILTVLYALLIVGVVTVILFDNGDSGRKFAWLLIIAVLPVIGLVLYFTFGINYRHHWVFNRRHQRYKNLFAAGTTPELDKVLFGDGLLDGIREDFRPLAKLLRSDTRPAVTAGNDIEVITTGRRKFELLRQDILAAKESIHIEYFHFGDDKGSKAIRRLLMQKAAEGVKVRFLHENIANFPIKPSYYAEMEKAGVEVVKFTNPRQHLLDFATKLNYRNHRKIVVIDGKIGYTGGMNINDRYFKLWRDTHLRITGPAVATLQYTFLDSWLTGGGTIDRKMVEYYPMAMVPAASCEVCPAGVPCPDAPLPEEIDFKAVQPVLKGKLMQIVPDEPDLPLPILQLSYEWILQHARKYIYLQTPYFVPPEPVMDALKTAALCGVDVRLMLPEVADNLLMRPANKAYYEEALLAGVRIFLRKGEFIHSKTFVCDDYLSSVGSANLDYRSFTINYEVNTYIYDEQTALLNKGIFLSDLKLCSELTLEEWAARPWHSRLLESLVRLFAPLL
jgi:cardiolipin synthase A/B